MRTLFDRAIGFGWAIFAGGVITAAILISVVRLVLPQIDEQRPAIEQWISETVGRPVAIGKVAASWRGWNPTIDVTNLAILAPDRKTELVRFETASVDIAPLASIKHRDLVPQRFTVSGMKIALLRDANGQISIAGMPPARWPVARWLLQQRNFTLRNAQVSFDDVADDRPAANYKDVSLLIVRDESGQRISGRLYDETHATETYTFALDFNGDLLTSDWSGTLALDIANARLAKLVSFLNLDASKITSGLVAARINTRWQQAKLETAAINTTVTDITSHTNRKIPDTLNAKAVVKRTSDGWSVGINQLDVEPDQTIPGGALSLRWRTNNDRQWVGFRGENIDLSKVAQYLPLIAADSNVAVLHDVDPRGNIVSLEGFVSQINDHAPRFFVDAEIKDLTSNAVKNIPGVSGFDFRIRANNRDGVVDVSQTGGVVVDAGARLSGPVALERILGVVQWSQGDAGLDVRSSDLKLRIESFDFATRGSLFLPSGAGKPVISAVAAVNGGDLSRLKALVPIGVFPPRGEKWSLRAFHAGELLPSQIVFRGSLADFPFDEGQGTFKAAFAVRDVKFQYGLKWPIANGMAATMAFDRRQIVTSVTAGDVFDAEVAGSTIEIPNLFTRQRVVRIRGKTVVNPDKLGEFILASPLKNTKATRYENVDITGDMGMTLDMNLGIYPGGAKEILGLMHFSGNRIHSKTNKITLEDVDGDISFTRQDWYGEGLSATFDGDRVGVVLNGGLDDPNYDTEFRMTGTSDASKLLKYLERYAPVLHLWITRNKPVDAFVGQLPWKAVLTIPEIGEEGEVAPKRLIVESSLVGLDVDLPWPFGKTSAEKKPLSVLTETRQDGFRRTRIDYGNTVDVELKQQRNADQKFATKSGEILFGTATPVFEHEPGLRARGRVDRLPLNEWIAFIKRAIDPMRTPAGEKLPMSFDLEIARLETLGRQFPDAHLTGNRLDEGWRIEVEGERAKGRVSVPPLGAASGRVEMNFDRLWLEKIERSEQTAEIDPRSFPAISLTAESLRYGEIDLGATKLVTNKVENGLELIELNFAQQHFSLQGTGEWLIESGSHQSRVSLAMNGKTLGDLLNSFDYEVANIDGGATEIEIQALWSGMPSDFELDKLNGNFQLRVEEGRFLDIDPGGGRLFGLLSLQTLPRRLSLDFNDLFKKGFTFDHIEGTFELDRGNAYTNSLLMTGPSARIDISGRTGLADQDYDQRVTVTPALSDTIPVASALFGPAGIGVGAVIYLGQKMFKSIPEQVDKFLSREYSITGPWAQPVIERI